MRKLHLAMVVLALLLLPACTTESPENNNDQTGTTEQETSTTIPETTEPEATEPEATEPEATEPETTEPEAAEPETTLTIGDSGTLGDWEITLDSFEVTDSIPDTYGSFSPDEGNKYVAVSVTVKNNGKSADTFLPSFSYGNSDVRAKVLYKGEYEFSATNLMGYSDGLHDSTLNPLSSKSGVVAFSVVDEAAESDELTLVLSLGKNVLEFSLK